MKERELENKIFKDGEIAHLVTYDLEGLKELRQKLVENMSIIDHFHTANPMSPYYLPNKKYGNIEIKHYCESYITYEDLYKLCESHYDKYVIPYLARLIDGVIEEESYDAVQKIENPRISREYIPIKETIEEYTKIITAFEIYTDRYSARPFGNADETAIARNNLQKYIDIMMDTEYPKRFIPYYEEAKNMISSIELEKTPKSEKKGKQKQIKPINSNN